MARLQTAPRRSSGVTRSHAITARRRRVAALFAPSGEIPYRTLQGVADYARRHDWQLLSLSAYCGLEPLSSVQGWDGDGIIAAVNSAAEMQAVRRPGLPVVNYAAQADGLGLPTVICDNPGIGRMAAEYFQERGHRHFAFFGRPDSWWSREREKGFREFLATRKMWQTSCWMREPGRRAGNWERQQEMIGDWLARLPKPVAVFACADPQARRVSVACRSRGCVMPDEVALVGVDNDRLVCEFAEPTLSSIETGMQRVGYEAAALLDRLMAGAPPPDHPIRIPPRNVVTRESSDFLAVSDARVATALRFIDESSGRDIGVADVADAVGLGRRSLERLFVETIGRNPAAEIRRARMRVVQRLLAETTMPIAEVARTAGFCDASRLGTVFRGLYGASPTAWRRSQAGASGRFRVEAT